jgi:hypothetical protein
VRVPSDGGAKSVRALLNQLDEHSIEVETSRSTPRTSMTSSWP